jgi:hypothetical protein
MGSWSVEFLDDDIEALLEAMPGDIQASFRRIAEMIRAYGLEKMREPYVKHLEGPVWEMRMSGRSGIARAAYVDSDRETGGCGACLRKEDAEDSAAGN